MSIFVVTTSDLPWRSNAPVDPVEVTTSAGQEEFAPGSDTMAAPGSVYTETIVAHEKQTHHKQGMPQLDDTWFASQLFWLFICFTVLFLFMQLNIIPRIREVLESRQHRIDADLEHARNMQKEAAAIKETYEGALEEARHNVQSLIASAQKKNNDAAFEAHKQLDKEISDQFDTAERDIEASLDEAREKVVPIASEITEQVVNKVIKMTPDNALVTRTVKKIMKQLTPGS